MKHLTPAALIVAAFAGTTLAGDGTCTHTGCSEAPGVVSSDEAVLEGIAEQLIHSLPLSHQRQIVEAGGMGADAVDLGTLNAMHAAHEHEACEVPEGLTVEGLRDYCVSEELDARLTDFQRRMIDRIIETFAEGNMPPAMCFAPGTDSEFIEAIHEMHTLGAAITFQQTGRWSRTATDGSGLNQGDPTTITYSYVPDGTFVPNLIGVSGNSNFQSWMNGIYGSPANWQPLFDQVFDRWAELIGTSYVYEPNDDGSNLNGQIGVLGVRGDVRIAAIGIDGNSGTLAYNNFPNDGDMVFDSADNAYNSTGGNSLLLRNVIAHEHGHGLGMLHVCPIQNNKLMEPFLSTSFDGPQLDDILNGHRHYGDPFEPNNTPVSGTDLGSAGVGGFGFFSNHSVDDNSDDDYFIITLTEPGEVSFTVSPDAAVITQGPQTQSCNTGTNTDYNSRLNLRLAAFSPDDLFTPFASSDTNSVGQDESFTFEATTAGVYYVRVDTGDSANRVQRYDGLFSVAALPFLGPVLSADEPTLVEPGVTTDFSVTIDPREDDLDGTPTLFSSVNGGSFSSSPLTFNGGSDYTATLPAVDCGDSLAFYIEITADVTGTQTLPGLGAVEPYLAQVSNGGMPEVVLNNNFESDTGWSVSSTTTIGEWERVTPSQGGDSRVADPANDSDGSGMCYVTGNGPEEDLDDGITTLTSPAFDLSNVPGAIVKYDRWFDNNEDGSASNAFSETMLVEISDDNGSNWVLLEEVGPNGPEVSGGWFSKSFDVSNFVSLTDSVRVRFVASDLDGTIVEAGVDAFEIQGLPCEDPVVDPCEADLDDSGVLDFGDVSTFLALFAGGDSAVDFDNSGSLDFGDVSAFLALFAAGCP